MTKDVPETGLPEIDAEGQVLSETPASVKPAARPNEKAKRRKTGDTNSQDLSHGAGVQLNDFVAYMPLHSYIFRPDGAMWPAASVNARLGLIGDIAANVWLDRNQAVEQMTWAPGYPQDILDKLVKDGGWNHQPGCVVFNTYRPPSLQGRPGDAGPWLRHVRKLYGDDAHDIIKWLAHRVQFPDQKINHALVLGGSQGIGKDTILEPIKHAIGPWNFKEVSPVQLLGRFNGFLKSVVLRVSEARDLGDVNRYAFYEHMKVFTAAPPDVLRVDEKHVREYAIFNVCGVILTTNHKTDGLYLPADDRRHLVVWSDTTLGDFDDGYYPSLYRWYQNGGNEIVADYLAQYDLTGFDAKAPPRKTPAFWEIVGANDSPENAELLTVLEDLGMPDAVTIDRVRQRAETRAETTPLYEWLSDRRNRKAIPHRLEDCGYVRVQNPDNQQGLWTIAATKQAAYSKSALSLRDRLAAVGKLR